jgi:hypothetical protein
VYFEDFENSSSGDEKDSTTVNLGLAVPMGIFMYLLSLVTVVGNAMVLHAIRTERRLQTVSTNNSAVSWLMLYYLIHFSFCTNIEQLFPQNNNNLATSIL